MLATEAVLVRVCPSCLSERPGHEVQCENPVAGGECGWSLLEEPLRALGGPTGVTVAEPATSPAHASRCTNGHPLDEGDQLCLACGAGPSTDGTEPVTAPIPAATEVSAAPTVIDGWTVLRRLPVAAAEPWERFIVGRDGGDALQTLYNAGAEPDPAVHEVLRRLGLTRKTGTEAP